MKKNPKEFVKCHGLTSSDFFMSKKEELEINSLRKLVLKRFLESIEHEIMFSTFIGLVKSNI